MTLFGSKRARAYGVLVSLAALVIALAVGAAPGTALADEMWGVDSSGDGLYLWDSDTARVKYVIGPLHPDPSRFTTPVSIAVSDRRVIYVQNNSPPSDAGLSTIDPLTGRATYIGPGLGVEGAISFGPGGRLYGFDPLKRLCTVNLSTGAITRVPGAPRLPIVYGMDYDPGTNRFFAITSPAMGATPDLLQIDPATGIIVSIRDTAVPIIGVPKGLSFNVDGNLIMTSSVAVAYVLDPATGRLLEEIRGARPEPQGVGLACRGDFNKSGNVNFLDFLSFQNAFDAGDLAADLDYDGVLTVFDFLEFQNVFAEGCR